MFLCHNETIKTKEITMKIATIVTAALLLGMMPLMAEDVATTDVDAQIEEIQQAPAQERYRLMNQFKKQLGEMNAEDRAAAIAKLQDRTMTQDQLRDQTQDQTQDRTRDQIRDQDRLQDGTGDQIRTQEQQMQQLHQMDQLQQQQQMNQMQQQQQMQGSMGQQPAQGTQAPTR